MLNCNESIDLPNRRRAAQLPKVERLSESLIQHFVDGTTQTVILPKQLRCPANRRHQIASDSKKQDRHCELGLDVQWIDNTCPCFPH